MRKLFIFYLNFFIIPYIAKTPDKRGNNLNCNDSIAWAIKLNKNQRRSKNPIEFCKYKNQKPQKGKEVIEFCEYIVSGFFRKINHKIQKKIKFYLSDKILAWELRKL